VITALMSNSIDCYWAPISAALSAIKGGKLRALAVSTTKRNPTLPDVPTLAEGGLKNADSALWFGVWAPAGTPAPVVQKISADVRKALADPGVKEKLHALGNDTMDMPPEEFAKFVRDEIGVYQAVITAAGIKPQ
jgi:tripartite-type tricarboxylate transporter receptor subunit TctC